MKIEAKLKYGYQKEAPVTIVDIYDDGDAIIAICIGEDGTIRSTDVTMLEVTDGNFLPTKGGE